MANGWGGREAPPFEDVEQGRDLSRRPTGNRVEAGLVPPGPPASRLRQVQDHGQRSPLELIPDDAHLREREALVEVSAPDIPPRLAVGAPGRFAGTGDVGIRRLTPSLGQDEEYVFGELLGLSGAQRADLETREVIC